jgi:hypothetical protein
MDDTRDHGKMNTTAADCRMPSLPACFFKLQAIHRFLDYLLIQNMHNTGMFGEISWDASARQRGARCHNRRHCATYGTVPKAHQYLYSNGIQKRNWRCERGFMSRALASPRARGGFRSPSAFQSTVQLQGRVKSRPQNLPYEDCESTVHGQTPVIRESESRHCEEPLGLEQNLVASRISTMIPAAIPIAISTGLC